MSLLSLLFFVSSYVHAISRYATYLYGYIFCHYLSTSMQLFNVFLLLHAHTPPPYTHIIQTQTNTHKQTRTRACAHAEDKSVRLCIFVSVRIREIDSYYYIMYCQSICFLFSSYLRVTTECVSLSVSEDT